MLKTILALALSAATLAALGAAGVHVVTGTEAGFLQAQQQSLQAEALAGENELKRWPWEAQRLAGLAAADPNLGAILRQLVATVEVLDSTSNAKMLRLLQPRADAMRRQLKGALDGFRRRHPEAEGMLLISTDGDVMVGESTRFAEGDNMHAFDAKETVPEAVLRALAGTAHVGARLATSAPQVWFGAAEPLWVKGKVAGAVLVEMPLRKLPGLAGGQVLVVADSHVVMGKAPAGYAISALQGPRAGQVALVAQRTVEGRAGAFSMPLLDIDPEHVGLWGARFKIPGTDKAYGVVFSDLSDSYRELAEKQVQITVLTCMAWGVVALLVAFLGFSMRGESTQPMAKTTQPTAKPAPSASPWSDLPLAGGGASDDDGYQPLDTFDLPGEAAGPERAAPGGVSMDEALAGLPSAVSSLHSGPQVVLGDLLETQVPDQHVGHEEPSWSDAGVSPRVAAAAAAFEPPPEPVEAEPPPLTAAADAALQGGAGGPSARDQLLAMLNAKGPKPSPPAPPPQQMRPQDDAGWNAVSAPDALELDTGASQIQEAEPIAEAEPLQEVEAVQEIALEHDPVEAQRQTHYRQVFEEFVRLRKSCNEPGELAFDKFIGRLNDTRAAVMAKHQCTDVMFAAYVKNGKAALKATPR